MLLYFNIASNEPFQFCQILESLLSAAYTMSCMMCNTLWHATDVINNIENSYTKFEAKVTHSFSHSAGNMF